MSRDTLSTGLPLLRWGDAEASRPRCGNEDGSLLPLNLTWLWLMRRFGFLTAPTHGLVSSQVVFLPRAPGWMLERTQSLYLIPDALAG